MLVLRLLVMVLTIICLMDGHAEVSSSTTGIRDRRESPAVKTNDSEVEILDRKKKKKPKPSKKKKPKPGKKKKPNNKKPVTTTPTVSTSTLKTTTILTTPTVTTTVTTTTTTVSPTTTATTTKTTTSTASATTTLSTTTSATTTVATSSTASTTTTTIPTTATTSSPPTTAATTADSGAGGECKATNGKPCIFPFKDGKEYNECKNEGGRYFWCATSVYDSGKYKHWSYCPEDRSCPLEGDGECRATNNKPCVFPFKDGKKEYNECADHGGQYFWCATGTNSAGKYTAWSKCPKDGSCPLLQKSTTPVMTPTAAAATTTPLTTGTTAATDQMEEKVLDTLENLVLGESRDDGLKLAHMLDKKLDTIIKDLEGETSKTELRHSDDIPPQSGKLNLTIKRDQDDKLRDGTELGEGLMFVLSTVDSMKSMSRVSGDCCQDCISEDPGTELAEYWDTLKACYCYKKMKTGGIKVEPKTRPSNEFSTKACGCRTATKADCPTEHTFIKGGFPEIPYDGMLKIGYNVNTKCACRQLCDDKSDECKAFLFKTCNDGPMPRCILINKDKPAITSTGQYNDQYAFCRRDRLIVSRMFEYGRMIENNEPGAAVAVASAVTACNAEENREYEVILGTGHSNDANELDGAYRFSTEVSELVWAVSPTVYKKVVEADPQITWMEYQTSPAPAWVIKRWIPKGFGETTTQLWKADSDNPREPPRNGWIHLNFLGKWISEDMEVVPHIPGSQISDVLANLFGTGSGL